MRLRKLVVLSGAAIGALVLATSAPVSATPLVSGLSKGLAKMVAGSPIIRVRRRNRNRGRNRVRGAAAAAAGAAAIFGIIGAAAEAQRRSVIDECLARHSDVDTERGVWFDRRGDEHPCP